MKTIKLLILAFGVFAASNLLAQNSSKLSGKEFKVFINKSDMPSPETQVEDIITFTGSKASSQTCASRGMKAARFTEKLEGTQTKFQMTLTQSNGETWAFDGFMEDNHMGGTITVTRTGQAPETLIFRGMTTQLWDALQMRRESERTSQ
ncbi:MAG TPA: hypothetical protein VFW78_04100 [Bacteroidia bacterium]|nr:hypothetical protein [Bacteroidia bacterium]